MEEDDHPSSTQLIDGDGVFNVSGMEDFSTMTGFTEVGLSYAVVSIVGPQSSGKSTLLNHLFRTNFTEMDAFKGRSQTTKGIWIEKSVDIKPYTIVLDLEGTDGRERGEDDTSFEKKSALFALAVSDVVLINMWCHDIGREQAANKPLLKTVFQVMMRLFSPRRTTLFFVIRDKTKTPLESLEPVLREDIQKIWDNVPKPQTHKDTPISDFFNVEIVALPNYETKEEEFNEQVLQLRQRFFNSIAPGNLAGDRRGVIPASGFSFSAQQIWTIIKENKELDLPAHKVMVATVRCEEIASEKLSQLASDEGWLMLQAAVKFGPLVGFGKKLGTIIDTYLSEYDMEAAYFDEGVRTVKRKEMELKALDLAHPAYHAMMIHLRSKVLDSFKKRFEESLMRGEQFFAAVRDCTDSSLNDFDLGYQDVVVKNAMWTSLKAREKLLRDIETHTASVCTAKLSELVAEYENKLAEALEHPVVSLLDVAEKDCWASIRRVFKKEVEKATSGFLAALMGLRLDNEPCNQLVEGLKNFARSTVERKARDEAAEVLIRMKDRFLTEFSHDHDSLPRVWTGKEDIRKITKDASAAALNLLAVLAVIRMEERPDKIAAILSSLLSDGVVAKERSNDVSSDSFTSKAWEEVPPEDVLITPVQCQQVWKRFNMDIEYIVSQAQSALEAHRRNSSWMPPWAFLAIGILGFNEFMLLLKNPFYLMAVLVMFLVFKAIWVQLDVPGELENGIFPGLLRLCYRIIPTTVTVLRRVAQKDKKQLSNVAKRPQQTPEESQHENTEIHHSPQRLHVPMRRNVQSFMIRTQRIPTRTNSMPADKYSRLSSMISISERELEQIVSQSRLECTEEEQPTSDSLEERL